MKLLHLLLWESNVRHPGMQIVWRSFWSSLLFACGLLTIASAQTEFLEAPQYSSGNAPLSVAVGDFNRDGKLDLVTANNNFQNTTVSVLLGNGDGTFQRNVEYATGGTAWAVTVADFNGDGIVDLATANENVGKASVLLGNGDGTFQPHRDYAVGGDPESIVAADFNGDGKPDLTVANALGPGGSVSVLLGNGDGTFKTQIVYTTGSEPVSVAVGDFNRDGKIDLVLANSRVVASAFSSAREMELFKLTWIIRQVPIPTALQLAI